MESKPSQLGEWGTGGQAGFVEFLVALQQPVRAYIGRRLRSRSQEVDDVLSDWHIRVLLAWSSGAYAGDGWREVAFKFAERVVLDHWRGLKRRGWLVLANELTESSAAGDSTVTPALAIDAQSFADRLRESVPGVTPIEVETAVEAILLCDVIHDAFREALPGNDASLSPEMWRVVLLKLAGESAACIRRELGLRNNRKVYTLHSRARKLLRAALGEVRVQPGKIRGRVS